FGKLEAEETPARLQHPESLRQGLVDMRDVANTERDRIGIEAPSLERKSLGITLQAGDAVLKPGFGNTAAADLEHFRADVTNDSGGRRAAVMGIAERDVACSPGDVEQPERRCSARGIDQGNELAFPEPVQPAR